MGQCASVWRCPALKSAMGELFAANQTSRGRLAKQVYEKLGFRHHGQATMVISDFAGGLPFGSSATSRNRFRWAQDLSIVLDELRLPATSPVLDELRTGYAARGLAFTYPPKETWYYRPRKRWDTTYEHTGGLDGEGI